MLERFSANFFLRLGRYLQELTDRAPTGPRIDLIEPIIGVQIYLDVLYTDSDRPVLSLKTSAASGKALHDKLEELQKTIRDKPNDASESLGATDIESIKEAIRRFENILGADLARAFTYAVSQVGILAVDSLVESADDVFEGYKERIPKAAIADTKEAGRSIAFNLPTAAGFHIARATEAVLLKYLHEFGQKVEKESQRNWGKYTCLLRTNTDASKKVLNTIDQIRTLHRNPLLHPEDTLTMPEALSLWAICTSAIQAMTADMERKLAEPKKEILEMLPPEREDSGEDAK
jgi:hypothetical protein